MSEQELKAWQNLQKRHGHYYGQKNPGPAFGTDTTGHEVWYTNRGPDGYDNLAVHRLLVIAAGESPYRVFNGDTNVHHKNHIPWDNRPDNLELLTTVEHGRKHALDRIEKGTFPSGARGYDNHE